MSPLAITGLGVISRYGIGATVLIDGLMGSATEGSPRTGMPPEAQDAPVGIADTDVAQALSGERTRTMNRETRTLLATARLALADAGLGRFGGERDGIVVSTCHAGVQDYADLYRTGVREGPRMVNPARGPQTGLNAPAAHLGIRLAAEGPNMTVCNGNVGGLDALAYAATTLYAGAADAMLVCGVELASHLSVPACSPRSPAPSSRSRGPSPRPFDRERSGAVAGEAAAVAVLERESDARRRGALPRARLGAVASAFSPEHELADASLRSLVSALQRSPASADSLVAALAGADGSVAEDAAEARALHSLLGGRVPVCAVQGGIASCGGATALAQVAVAVLALERGMLPPTVGYRSRGEDVAPIRVLAGPQPIPRGPVAVSVRDGLCCAASAVLLPPPAPCAPSTSKEVGCAA